MSKTTPQITAYKNPKTIKKLIFNDRLNTSYTAVDEPIESFEIGEQPTYVDYIKNALNPNLDENANIYGIAKTLKPLTTRLNEMKANIDNANSAYFDLKKKVQEQEQDTPKETVVDTPAATPDAQGGTNA